MDIDGKAAIRSFISELNERDGVTMIFTTHDMQDIEKTCERLIVIDKGSMVYDGSIASIRELYGTTRRLDVEFDSPVVVEPPEGVDVQPLKGANGRRVRLTYEHKKVKINELMNHLLSHYNVRDLNVSEPEIEDIIREILS